LIGKYNLFRYLTDTLGKGFSEANIKNFRQFYLIFPNGIQFARRPLANPENLSLSHLCAIMLIDDNAEYYFDGGDRLCGGTDTGFGPGLFPVLDKAVWKALTSYAVLQALFFAA
jgi:hypothetical protein